MHLVGFTREIYYDARPYGRQSIPLLMNTNKNKRRVYRQIVWNFENK